MTERTRLIELAIKGLESERQRIDSELSALRRQLGPGAARLGKIFPLTLGAEVKKSNLTPAGRKKLSDMMKKRWAERRKAKAGR